MQDEENFKPLGSQINTEFKEGVAYKVRVRQIDVDNPDVADDEKTLFELIQIAEQNNIPLPDLLKVEFSEEKRTCKFEQKVTDCQLRRVGGGPYGLDYAIFWYGRRPLPKQVEARDSGLTTMIDDKEVPLLFVHRVLEPN